MTTDYDPIADDYKRSKELPWRGFIERFTLLNLMGNIEGKSVLDVACGEGFYTRMLREQGANQVTGIDISQGMIDLARQQEKDNQLGIEYVVEDARELTGEHQYDLVLAAWLFNYARTAEELSQMCQSVAKALKPAGRLVAVNCNPACDFRDAPSYREYGFETSLVGPWQEGTPITWRLFLSDGHFEIENYHLSQATHEIALKSAGFTTVAWKPAELSPAALKDNAPSHWDTIMNHPPFTFLECVKG